ncbi:hypothetical protein XENOCAPTIV_014560 [Xenoophorus captivus]|uniref:Uncharacterized protein n=1 Tax=Xenoophorus captivus TaxID=1517983 RepID=A0ABV0QEH2_9TELE
MICPLKSTSEFYSASQKHECPLNLSTFCCLEKPECMSIIFSCALTSFPFPAKEQHLHSMMLPPPCVTVWVICCSFSAKNSSVLLTSDQSMFFHMLLWKYVEEGTAVR